MVKYKRVIGGEKNKLSGIPFSKEELEEVCDLYIEIDGKGIHENNPKIHVLAKKIGRTIRSVENQLLGFRAVDTKTTGRNHPNSLIPKIWNERLTKKELIEPNDLVEEEFDEFKFRISSYLKNILGKELITDEFVAVFELVKNSYDAHARNVKIIFEEDKITIWDDGKGMNRRDIIDKWLFVAHSAKSTGEEDIEFTEKRNESYRNKINPDRNYAGAKGIGRFSADSLGSKLDLTTRKINKSSYWELSFNWNQYDKDSKKQFGDIDIHYKKSLETSFPNFEHGLILEISSLRTLWGREKIIKLKESLEKLINPFTSVSSDGKDEFNIQIICEEEKSVDNKIKLTKDYDYRSIVNGYVENFVFEILKIKTTKIIVRVSNDSNHILTELIDRGELIYRISEGNKYKYIPANSSIQIFYLNRSAKLNFKKRMKIDSINFGSIFLFNNGFRVYPYGEPENDPFGINRRKSQGHSRYLGSREIIGSVEIGSKSEQFIETTSRDGGLIESSGTIELEDFFLASLRKIEKYIEPILWKIKKRTGEDDEKLDLTAQNQIIEFVEKISGQPNIKLQDYSTKLIQYIKTEISEKQVIHFKKLKNIALNTGNLDFLEEIEKSEKIFDSELKIRKEEEVKREEAEKKLKVAEERAKAEETARIKAENEVARRKEQITRYKSAETIEYKDLRDSNHIVGVYSDEISKKILLLKRKLEKGKVMEKEALISFLQGISLANEKISTITRFTTKSNFLKASLETKEDVVSFIANYIEKTYKALYKIDIQILNREVTFVKIFQPIELSVIIDNILSNSRKKNAKKVIFEFNSIDNYLEIRIRDIGDRLSESIENSSLIFEEGITTTKGSGLGLNHVKRIIEDDMNGTIEYNPEFEDGFELILKIKNEN